MKQQQETKYNITCGHNAPSQDMWQGMSSTVPGSHCQCLNRCPALSPTTPHDPGGRFLWVSRPHHLVHDCSAVVPVFLDCCSGAVVCTPQIPKETFWAMGCCWVEHVEATLAWLVERTDYSPDTNCHVSLLETAALMMCIFFKEMRFATTLSTDFFPIISSVHCGIGHLRTLLQTRWIERRC